MATKNKKASYTIELTENLKLSYFKTFDSFLFHKEKIPGTTPDKDHFDIANILANKLEKNLKKQLDFFNQNDNNAIIYYKNSFSSLNGFDLKETDYIIGVTKILEVPFIYSLWESVSTRESTLVFKYQSLTLVINPIQK